MKDKIPRIYNFVHQCYVEKYNLKFGSETIFLMKVHQRDPLSSFLFLLRIQDITHECKSDLNVWYLDDGTLAGDVESVFIDATMGTNIFSSHELEVNPSKSEIFLVNPKSNSCPIKRNKGTNKIEIRVKFMYLNTSAELRFFIYIIFLYMEVEKSI